MYLKARYENGETPLVSDLSPLPQDGDVLVRSPLPLEIPWRVIMIGQGPGRLIESNLSFYDDGSLCSWCIKGQEM